MAKWFNTNVAPDWMELRARLMRLLQDEAELEEIVQLVGMDALSAPDRLKLEAARSIREDFLHQNAFHEMDTYTSLEKQHDMMLLVIRTITTRRGGAGKGRDGRRPDRAACARAHRPVQVHRTGDRSRRNMSESAQRARQRSTEPCKKEDF